MWRKNLILSLVIAMALPFGNAGAAPTGLQDEAQPQVSTGDKGVTTVPAIETALAVPADVKWAHRLATVFAALGAIAGVAQLWYILEYSEQARRQESFEEERWYCGKMTRDSRTVWVPNVQILQKQGLASGIAIPVVAQAAGWLYRHPPVMKPETIFTQNFPENIAKLCGVVLAGYLGIKYGFISMFTGLINLLRPNTAKGLSLQMLAFGGMLLCKTYAVLRVGYLNHKAAVLLTGTRNSCEDPIEFVLQVAAFGGSLLCKAYATMRSGYLNHKAAVLLTGMRNICKDPKGFVLQVAAFGGSLLCKAYATMRSGYLNHKAAILLTGMRNICKDPKGFVLQLAALGGSLLCEANASLRLWHLNHKAAEALANKTNTAAVAGDQTEALKLA